MAENERKLLLIACPNTEFIKTREEKLLQLIDGRADLRVITDKHYFIEYFSEMGSVDVLIIDRSFYEPYLEAQNINHMIVLNDEIPLAFESENENTTHINMMKYVSEEEFLEVVEKALVACEESAEGPDAPAANADQLTVVAVYSPVGGCGVSTTALGLGRKLARLEEKVLVVGCDDMQSIGALLESRENADDELAAALKEPSEETYWTILKNICMEGVSCLMPFEQPLYTLGVGADEFITMLNILEKKRDFSYVILDLGSAFNDETFKLMKRADVNICVTEPVITSCRKLEKVFMNRQMMDYNPDYIVGNQHHSDHMRLDSDYLFGSIADYPTQAEALDDPLLYSLALEISMKEE